MKLTRVGKDNKVEMDLTEMSEQKALTLQLALVDEKGKPAFTLDEVKSFPHALFQDLYLECDKINGQKEDEGN